MRSPMDDVLAGKAEEAVNGGRAAGDCLRACVASVLDLDLDDVPHFVQYIEHPEGSKNIWYWALVGFCAAYGWKVDYVEKGDETPAPRGWTFIDGKSPRGHSHVVVGHDGTMVHDPHPSGAGLMGVVGWFTLERLCSDGHPLCDGRPLTCLVRESEALGLYELETTTLATPHSARTTRTNDGVPGDCLRAALASILGMDEADVPHFSLYGEGLEPPDKHGWWWALVGFCATLDPPYDVLVADEPPPPSESLDDLFGCYLASGKSPRGDWNHVVVARGGQVIWDPHPSRDGLDGPPVELNYLVRRTEYSARTSTDG